MARVLYRVLSTLEHYRNSLVFVWGVGIVEVKKLVTGRVSPIETETRGDIIHTFKRSTG